MLPKEHGAYGQLVFPIAASILVGGTSAPALLVAAAAAGAFVSHEPLLVLIGHRGPRAARESGRRAAAWLALATTVTLTAGLTALWLAPDDAREAFAWPLAPLAAVGVAIVTGREKTTFGELSVAAAFSAVPIPICRAAGLPMAAAMSVALTFFGLFAASTLAVRVVILGVRSGGDAAAVRRTRRVLLAVVVAVLAVLATAAARGLLPWTPLAAIAPSWVVSGLVAFWPPPPTQLRRIGWTLMAASCAAALILALGLPGID